MKQRLFFLFKVTYRDFHQFFGSDRSNDEHFTARDWTDGYPTFRRGEHAIFLI